MTILYTIPANLAKTAVFNLVKAKDWVKMSTLADKKVEVAELVVWQDTDRQTGEIKTVVTLKDSSGVVAASNSGCFVEDINTMHDLLSDGNTFPAIMPRKGTAKSGRQYLYCEVAD